MIRLIVVLGLLGGGVFFVLNQENKPTVNQQKIITYAPVPATSLGHDDPSASQDPETIISGTNNSLIQLVVEDLQDTAEADESLLKPITIKSPLTALTNSDNTVRATLTRLLPNLKDSNFLKKEQVLMRFITLINDIAQGDILFKHRQYLKPVRSFPVVTVGESLVLDPQGYHRFDGIVSTFMAVDSNAAIAWLKANSALVAIAFAQFGHSKEFPLHQMLLQAIETVLAAPIIREDIKLITKNSRYQFANLDYEALSGVKKQMIRLGPDNTLAIQEKLTIIKAQLIKVTL
jgi:hypothetical protein